VFLPLLGLMSSMVDVVPWCRLHTRLLQPPEGALQTIDPAIGPQGANSYPPSSSPCVVASSLAPPRGGPVPSGTRECRAFWVSIFRASSISMPRSSQQYIFFTMSTAVETDSGTHRLYGCDVVPRLSGWHSKSLPLQGVDPALFLVREQMDLPEGEHVPVEVNRISPLRGTPIISVQTSPGILGGVAPSSPGGPLHLPQIGPPSYCAVCVQTAISSRSIFSWEVDSQALDRDALSQVWSVLAYAFPLIVLIPRLLLSCLRQWAAISCW
jgi:hypothetical protein